MHHPHPSYPIGVVQVLDLLDSRREDAFEHELCDAIAGTAKKREQRGKGHNSKTVTRTSSQRKKEARSERTKKGNGMHARDFEVFISEVEQDDAHVAPARIPRVQRLTELVTEWASSRSNL
eukprot:1834994-Rhodomonas_salina.1